MSRFTNSLVKPAIDPTTHLPVRSLAIGLDCGRFFEKSSPAHTSFPHPRRVRLGRRRKPASLRTLCGSISG